MCSFPALSETKKKINGKEAEKTFLIIDAEKLF
jgi:hypothetical protein